MANYPMKGGKSASGGKGGGSKVGSAYGKDSGMKPCPKPGGAGIGSVKRQGYGSK